MEKDLRKEMHDMSEKIYRLQEKSEKLTYGQRYAAINEIEKSIQPLRSDLRHLEHELYSQNSDKKIIVEQIEKIERQINELENIKSDLTARIHTETEHTRQQLNDKIINYMREELTPLKQAVENNKNEVNKIYNEIYELKIDIKESEAKREIRDAEKFDRFKWVITAVVAALAAISSLSLWLEPSVKMLVHIFFG